ncbi:prepilin peptidase [Pararhizobium sp. IMCC21322]|uniref:A24 family peptidase n=1 Tax=Pararhizobium sp. IMCC21322 TaxID=3067903 RepID=UPI002742164E|nr:prepilin peptidase [Pararhizobium sp. IMCC21322]
MIGALAMLVLVATGLSFLYAAFTDFRSWKIHNQTVLTLILLFALYAACRPYVFDSRFPPVDLLSALGAGALLFATGFLLWQFKLLGAGDAKLMFPIGLFLGWNSLLTYAFFLIGFAVIAMLLLRIPLPYGLSRTWPGMRLDEIRRTGKVPYGVVMVAAFFAILFVNYRLTI